MKSSWKVVGHPAKGTQRLVRPSGAGFESGMPVHLKGTGKRKTQHTPGHGSQAVETSLIKNGAF
ncbi:hypothetical protein TRIP_B200160 [uncultured Desulfatiglans sp.]|uniref:Uncharacterized protein n=1 Tax=Uncultured Desulfatiglans sp. TaxID=1748965 RepID=A0A653A1W5_UNCDX|nr:hypothetical protein TRIP_B200160 [uncultured Desulfatiglans sp.]